MNKDRGNMKCVQRLGISLLRKGFEHMPRISDDVRDVIEQAIYLPMLLIVLERDRMIFEKGNFKLRKPYLDLIEETLKVVHSDLKKAKQYMWKNNIKIEQIGRDSDFTHYMFCYNRFEEKHSYFHPRIRNKVQEFLEYYLYKRFSFQKKPLSTE